eukprot:CAMPEP_0197537894 /NCGR_PEP_ID=MMETSP1318-20131121/58179_1 /TAXON_ID=552666 /ORGANISM="Partenskyella glossopodia, Strain RCC365" /LENGTH=71 /DNA_ID=CAMNT_0043096169 /DNA_START=134 /DNA_END=346 /DNA_ORIENTATION=-
MTNVGESETGLSEICKLKMHDEKAARKGVATFCGGKLLFKPRMERRSLMDIMTPRSFRKKPKSIAVDLGDM